MSVFTRVCHVPDFGTHVTVRDLSLSLQGVGRRKTLRTRLHGWRPVTNCNELHNAEPVGEAIQKSHFFLEQFLFFFI